MELTDTDYQPRDLRVHRNYIIITSFILLFLKTGGVTIDSINILGVSFDFENIDYDFFCGITSTSDVNEISLDELRKMFESSDDFQLVDGSLKN